MFRYYSDYPEDEANKIGLELDCPALSHSLSFDPIGGKKVHVDEGLHRIKIASHRKWIEERYRSEYTGEFQWEQYWYYFPFVIMERAFSIEELTKIKWNSVIQSAVSEEFHYHPLYRILHKVENSLHHWSHGQKNYNQLVYWYNALKRFSFGDIPDIEVRLDYSTYYNSHGFSKHTRTYLDGPLSYIVYYKQKHVMTISFAPSSYGLLITQVQMKNKKGNRWLYKLPCDHVEYVVQCMAEAFNDTPIYFADGKTLADKVEAAYPKAEKHLFTKEKRNHIVNVYDREFEQFKRNGNQVTVNNIAFNQLKNISDPNSLEWFDDSMNYIPYKEAA